MKLLTEEKLTNIVDKLNCLYTDLILLRDEDWLPDNSYAEVSIDSLMSIANSIGIEDKIVNFREEEENE